MPIIRGTSFALCVAVLGCAEQPGATVEIVEPADGAVVEGPDVRVVLAAGGIEIAPVAEAREGTAHHHLFVDQDLTPLSAGIPAGVDGIIHLGGGESEFVLEDMEPGEHRVIALLADFGHVPLDPPAADTVRFTVVSSQTEIAGER